MSAQLPRQHPLALTGPIDALGLYASRQIADGRWLCVQARTFGQAQLGITCVADDDLRMALDAGPGYQRVWIYDSREAAIVALEMWDGVTDEPSGFLRRSA